MDAWDFVSREFSPRPSPADEFSTPGKLAAWATFGKEMQAPHLDLIDQAYVDISNGTVDRVAIFMPPRRGKSRRASRWGPLWFLKTNPEQRIAIASYAQSLAESHGRWVRDQIDTLNKGKRGLGIRLDTGSKAAERIKLRGAEEDSLIAVGIGSGLTGKGAHCFPAGTLVETDGDPVPIEDLVPGRLVRCHDLAAGRDEFRPVVAVLRRTAVGLVEFATEAGRLVRCTGGHLVYVPGSGWKFAGALRTGDGLVTPDGGTDAVVSLRDVPGGPVAVFDVQVAGVHTFYAGGLLVHNCLIIDDPVKDREEADSQLIRDKTWEWYTDVAMTRLEPGGSLILIQTRWHPDDLGGRILAEEKARVESGEPPEWRVLSLPELCEEPENDLLGRQLGEPLWPQRFSLANDVRTRRQIGARTWAALYQQRPAPASGTIVKHEWLKTIPESSLSEMNARINLTLVAVDPATEAHVRADETGIGVVSRGYRRFGAEWKERIWVRYSAGFHSTPEGWGHEACMVLLRYRAHAFVLEVNQGGDMGVFVIRAAWARLQAQGHPGTERICPPIRRVRSRLNKRLRFEPVAQYYEQGMVEHVGHAHQKLVDQMFTWVGEGDSPDVLDAVFGGIHELVAPTEKRTEVTTTKRWAAGGRR